MATVFELSPRKFISSYETVLVESREIVDKITDEYYPQGKGNREFRENESSRNRQSTVFFASVSVILQ